MRKLFSLFVALLATTCLWAYDFQSGDLYYNITSSSEPFTVEVTNNGTYTLTSAVIPSSVEYNGITYAVTSIGQDASGGYGMGAFFGCTSLSFISIPNSVTSIVHGAFAGCSSLTSISIPKSVTEIGKTQYGGTYRGPVFTYCPALTSIVVEEGNPIYDSRDNCNAIIETATNTLIAGCQNTTIPNSVTSIGDYAFNGCSSLTSFTIPNHITNIQSNPFLSCSSLATIVVESGNPIYDSRDNCNAIIQTTTNTLIAGCQNTTIPESVTSIGNSAFYYCSSLTSITIPEGVTSIEPFTFYGCSSLTSINIPENVTSIGVEAFGGCSSLTSINIPENVTSIGDGAFSGCSSLNAIYCYIVTPIQIIPRTFGSSYNKAILYVPCESLDAYFADKVWERFANIQCIGDEIPKVGNSIYYTSSDGNIVNPYNTDGFDAKIISNTYENGRGTITFDGLVGSIGDSAFYSCHRLTSITIPKYVDKIGAYAFYECSLLYSITCLETTPPSALDSSRPKQYSFQNYDATVYVPCEALEAYKKHRVWSKFADIQCIEEEEKTKSYIYYTSSDGNIVNPTNPNGFGANIISNTYENGQGIITFDGPITMVGDSAFCNCKSLTSITIPNSVKHFGYMAFAWCSNTLKKTNFIGDIADWCDITFGEFYANPIELSGNFYLNDQEVTELIIPNSVDSIHANAFRWCRSFKSITIPNSVTFIGKEAFEYSSNVKSIFIPKSVKCIQEGAFSGGMNLQSIIVEEGNPMYDSRENCNAIIETETNTLITGCSVTNIPESVTHIGASAFSYQGLNSIEVPDGIISIGDGAYYSCLSATSITIPKSVTNIGHWAFKGCPSLNSIKVEEGNSMYDSRNNCNAIIETATNSLIVACQNTVIPEGVTNIGEYAFSNCYNSLYYNLYYSNNRTSIVLPSSIKNIGSFAFMSCSALDTIYCNAITPPTTNQYAFDNYNATLYVPCESLEAYKAHEVWGRFNTIQCLEDLIPDPTERVLSCAEAVTICLETGATATTEEYTIHGYVTEITTEYSEQYKNISFYMADTKDGGQVLFTYRIKPMYEADIAVKVGDFVEVVGKLVNYNGYLPEVYPGVYTIVNEPELPTGTSDIQLPTSNTKKVVKDGQLLILRDGKTYTIMGAEIH